MASNADTGLSELLDRNELFDQHVADLARSGITREQALESGIRSAKDPATISAILLWEKPAKSLGPCLVFTFRNSDGSLALNYARVKPDKPRNARKGADKGKPIRYESPIGLANRCYFPAGITASLSDPSIPLLITEGEKKALKATLSGFPTVGLVGVWGWQQKRERDSEGRGIGERKLIPDLDAVVWSDRSVVIAFDSDAVRKPEVRSAESAIAEMLLQRGAKVSVVRLPESGGQGGEKIKCGLDDYLVSRTADDLRRLIEAATPMLRTAPDPQDGKPGRLLIDGWELTESFYSARGGRTFHCAVEWNEDDEPRLVKRNKLANFCAKIIGERVVDDGAEIKREWSVEIEQFKRQVITTTIPAERFTGLDWVVENAGPRCVIQPGSGKRDHLRCAIQELSGDDIPSNVVYAHTGWRNIGGEWLYLHGNGAIGPRGTIPAVSVSLHGATTNFRLPVPPTGETLTAAVRSSLRILNLAPDPVSFSLIAAVYRAALGSIDLALWLSGLTGVGKSEFAALGQQHFGPDMTRIALPGNWASTDNALEGLAFTIKDALLVVDDFCPAGSKHDHDRMHRVADRLIRGVANSAGRLRMFANGSLRPPRPPRAMIVGTGEDVPRGHSLAARSWTVEVQRGEIDFHKLGQCQTDAANGLYAAAMAGFVQWLAPRYESIRSGLDAEKAALRERLTGRYPHARTPDAVANMLLGFGYVLQFAECAKAIDQSERESLWNRGYAAFQVVAGRQSAFQSAHDPVERFADLLRSLLSSGRAHVAGVDGCAPEAPPAPEFWGWERREFRSGPTEVSTNWIGRGSKIGWLSDRELLLDPDSTYAEIVDFARMQGVAFPVGQDTLWRRLKERGKLIRTDKERTTCKVVVEGSRQRVLVMSAADMFALATEPGQPGQPCYSDTMPEETSDFAAPDSTNDVGDWGERPGHETKAAASCAPASSPTFSSNGIYRGTDVNAENRASAADSGVVAPTAPVAPDSDLDGVTKVAANRRQKLFDDVDLDALRR